MYSPRRRHNRPPEPARIDVMTYCHLHSAQLSLKFFRSILTDWRRIKFRRHIRSDIGSKCLRGNASDYPLYLHSELELLQGDSFQYCISPHSPGYPLGLLCTHANSSGRKLSLVRSTKNTADSEQLPASLALVSTRNHGTTTDTKEHATLLSKIQTSRTLLLTGESILDPLSLPDR